MNAQEPTSYKIWNLYLMEDYEFQGSAKSWAYKQLQ